MTDLIDRQAAIDALRAMDSRYLENERVIYKTDAVEAISMLPSAQPELAQDLPNACADTISRQEAIDALARTAVEKFNLSDEYNNYLAGLMDGELAIKALPPAQPEQRLSCKNCIHLGHGYMMPCKNCKRNQMLPDWYEVQTERKKND